MCFSNNNIFKKQNTMKMMMNREANSKVIPEDIIIEIFSRLPEKSICRFLCLSKQWNSILCSQYFIDLFHTMSSSKPHLLVLRERKYELDWKMFSSHQPMSSTLTATSYFHAKFSEYQIPSKGYFEGSYASGLIYFPGDGVRHGICNPYTKQYAILPPIKHSNGFLGFDPIGKQFKVLLYKEKRDDEAVYHVLTLGTKSERQREVKCPLTYGYPNGDHICINGVLYYETHDFGIGCFDVRSEKFFKLKKPGFFSTLVNYKGKLGLVYIDVHDYDDDYGYYELEITIWVLEDFGKLKWTKHVYMVEDVRRHFTSNAARFNLSVIGVTDSGEIVLAKTFSRKPFYVYFFNPSDRWRLLQHVEIEGVDGEEENSDNEVYVEIEGVDGEEENSDNEVYKLHYFMNHRANLGFDIMKKTTYGETCIYESAKTEASTSSN